DDRERRDLLRLDVENLELPVALVNDAARAVGAGPSQVPVLEERDLRGFAGGSVVAVEVEFSVAVGIEVDRTADPHRIAAGALAVCNQFGFKRFGIEDV